MLQQLCGFSFYYLDIMWVVHRNLINIICHKIDYALLIFQLDIIINPQSFDFQFTQKHFQLFAVCSFPSRCIKSIIIILLLFHSNCSPLQLALMFTPTSSDKVFSYFGFLQPDKELDRIFEEEIGEQGGDNLHLREQNQSKKEPEKLAEDPISHEKKRGPGKPKLSDECEEELIELIETQKKRNQVSCIRHLAGSWFYFLQSIGRLDGQIHPPITTGARNYPSQKGNKAKKRKSHQEKR